MAEISSPSVNLPPGRECDVVLCTHNPREDYLARTLAALQAQDLAIEAWTLTVIDNRSERALAGRCEVEWHPHGRVVREDELGLTAARLRGISETAAPLIVFVDDDNLLAPNYLTTALAIGRKHPQLGAWGAGIITPEFEALPPDWRDEYAGMLTLLRDTADAWGNGYRLEHSPVGAGLCVRRSVAQAYFDQTRQNTLRTRLGRNGAQLTCGEDTDMAWTACDAGLGVGRFVALQMQHLIPARRTTPEFLRRVTEDGSYSAVWLRHLRGLPQETEAGTMLARLARWRYERGLPRLMRELRQAARAGQRRAREEIVRAVSKKNAP